MLSMLISTFGEAAVTAILKAFTGWLYELRVEQTRQDLGASQQREVDINAEMERITKAAAAGGDPKLSDPNGVRLDPNNRDNQP